MSEARKEDLKGCRAWREAPTRLQGWVGSLKGPCGVSYAGMVGICEREEMMRVFKHLTLIAFIVLCQIL